MEIFLTALLVISLAGFIFIFVSKYIETRTGKIFFLPEHIHNRDEEIKYITQKTLRTIRIRTRQTFYTTLKFLSALYKTLLQRVKNGRSRSTTIPVENNGGGSVYLKRVLEHRNNVRNGNHDD